MIRAKLLSTSKTRYFIQLLPLLLMLVLLLGCSIFWLQPALENLMLNHRKSQIKDLVQVGWSIADELGKEAETGRITEEQAKERFIQIIKNLRYGDEMKDYFWVHDLKGALIMHPYTQPANLRDHQDKNGVYVLREMNRVASTQGEGFVDYYWKWKDYDTKEYPKVSFVKIYKPWGWVIGSGFYKHEAVKQIHSLNQSFVRWASIMILVLIVLIILSIKSGLQARLLLQKKDNEVAINWKRFENMAKHTSHGIAIFEHGHLVYINSRFCEILEIDCGRSDRAAMEEGTLKAIEMILQSFDTGEIVEVDPQSRTDVRGRWIRTQKNSRKYIVRRRNEDADHSTVYQFLTDWTRRKEQHQEINRLSQVIEDCPLSVVLTNKEGVITYANPFAGTSSGYTVQELVGLNPRALKSSRVPAAVYRELWQTILAGKTWQGELLNRSKFGELYWEYAIISPMLDDQDNIESFYAIKQDISHRKALEQQLQQAKEKAEESERIKSAFLNNISHEIRTPLNAISGFIHLLDDELASQPNLVEFRENIHENMEILLDLVDDILKVSELESSKSFADYEYWNIDEMLTEAVDRVLQEKTSGLSSSVSLRTSFDPKLKEKVVFTDNSKVQTILKELLSNAIKFTANGSIVVGYQVTANDVEFFVSDTGVGISDEEQPHVFSLFYHSKEHFVSLHKGTGVGLNIVKKIIRMMGGNIRFESQKGKGTTFYFSGICKTQEPLVN